MKRCDNKNLSYTTGIELTYIYIYTKKEHVETNIKKTTTTTNK